MTIVQGINTDEVKKQVENELAAVLNNVEKAVEQLFCALSLSVQGEFVSWFATPLIGSGQPYLERRSTCSWTSISRTAEPPKTFEKRMGCNDKLLNLIVAFFKMKRVHAVAHQRNTRTFGTRSMGSQDSKKAAAAAKNQPLQEASDLMS